MSSSRPLLAAADRHPVDGTTPRTSSGGIAGDRRVRGALVCGAVAGPLYVLSAGVQILTRDGFDLRRHAVSLLSNGDLGWIQITTFLAAGVLITVGAVGLRRVAVARGTSTVVPTLLGVYGVALVGAGLFVADPAAGFPVGTPTSAPTTLTAGGLCHLISGAVGFAVLAAACLVSARHARRDGQRGFARASQVTGVLLLATFAGVASGAGGAALNLAFSAAIALTWAWLTVLHVTAWRSRTVAAPATTAHR